MSDPKDFTHFGLDPQLLAAITEMGYTTPTPIQAKAIPVVLRHDGITVNASSLALLSLALLVLILIVLLLGG